MRRKRRAPINSLQRDDNENMTIRTESRQTPSLRMIKEIRKPFKGPTGRGLGKAGAKRLGRMLMQAMQPGKELSVREKASLPTTPIGLLEYHFQTEANKASADSPMHPSPQVSRFIGEAVSKYKSNGGMSMAELKQMLAAEGYDDSKNNRQMNAVTKRVENDATLVPITRSASIRLKNKADTARVNRNPVKTPKLEEEMKQNTTAHKIPKGAERSQQRGKKTPPLRRKSPKPTSKPGESHKQPSKTRKCVAISHEQGKKTPKSKTKVLKPAGKKGRSEKNQAKQARKSQKRTKRTRRRPPRRQAKHVQHQYKSQKRQRLRWKRHGARLRVQRRQRGRRTYNY